MERNRILVVGGTGRTGARLVQQLRADPTCAVVVLARDPKKAEAVLGFPEGDVNSGGGGVEVIQGDLLDLDPWAHRLDNIDQIVTAISCGVRSDPLVLLGIRPRPQNLPSEVDGEGVAQLAEAARLHGVRRIVAVTSASTGTPWAAAAMFLNLACYCSIKWKFCGEQAIRRSGVDYVIIRPFGLVDTPAGEETGLGMEFSQGRTEGTRRRIPREDVASLCHQALRQPAGSRLTFECWATETHRRPLPWSQLRPELRGSVPDVNHDTPVNAAAAGVACLSSLAAVGSARGVRRLLRWIRR